MSAALQRRKCRFLDQGASLPDPEVKHHNKKFDSFRPASYDGSNIRGYQRRSERVPPMHASPHQNRRRSHRVYLRTRIACLETGGVDYEGAVGNLAAGGVFVHAPAPYPVGTRLRVAFYLNGIDSTHSVEARGEVAWVRRHHETRLTGFGIRFVALPEPLAMAIQALLDRRQEASRALLLN